MRIAVAGGGPGGLYLAARAKQLNPESEVAVWERNADGETFGFGVVFSDETLGGIREADPAMHTAIAANFVRWTDIAVRYRGTTERRGGHGFAAISRKVLLRLLSRRCAEAGVTLHFRTPAPPLERLSAEYDLVVCADGANSAIRSARQTTFGTTLDTRTSRYIWLAVDKPFDALSFLIAETAHGPLHGHAYPFSAQLSTFIVEADERTWKSAGFADAAGADLTPDGTDRYAIAGIEEIFAEELDGHRLTGNRSRWGRFTVVRNRRWSHGNVVLLGDAAHTTHFSIGSGTKLAMEDALSLSSHLQERGSVVEALAAYEAERRPAVAAVQRAAQASLEWFEDIDRFVGRRAPDFASELLTRGGRLSYADLTAT